MVRNMRCRHPQDGLLGTVETSEGIFARVGVYIIVWNDLEYVLKRGLIQRNMYPNLSSG